MPIHIIAKLPIKVDTELLLATIFIPHPSKDRLGIVWVNKTPSSKDGLSSFVCIQIDLNNHLTIPPVIYECNCERIDDLKLGYDMHEQSSIVGIAESVDGFEPTRLVLHSIQMDRLVQGYPSFVVDTATDEVTNIGPLLMMDIDAATYRILHLSSVLEHLFTPDVCLTQVSKKEQYSSTVEVIDQAEGYLTCVNGEDCLLLTFRPELGEFADKIDGTFPESTYQWRFALQGGKRCFAALTWRYALQRGISVGDRANPTSDLDWLWMSADAINGPTHPLTNLATFVIGMTMADHFDYEAHGYSLEEEAKITKEIGHLLCIDTTGAVVQHCKELPGDQISLCLCGTTVIGVDRVNKQWRLWNWFPLTETWWNTLASMDTSVLHATVVTVPEGKEDSRPCFWLIEEYSDYLSITKHDAHTLEEVSSQVVAEGVSLLRNERNWQALDRHKPQTMFTYRETLLLLGIDRAKHLVLYQIK